MGKASSARCSFSPPRETYGSWLPTSSIEASEATGWPALDSGSPATRTTPSRMSAWARSREGASPRSTSSTSRRILRAIVVEANASSTMPSDERPGNETPGTGVQRLPGSGRGGPEGGRGLGARAGGTERRGQDDAVQHADRVPQTDGGRSKHFRRGRQPADAGPHRPQRGGPVVPDHQSVRAADRAGARAAGAAISDGARLSLVVVGSGAAPFPDA